VGGYGSSDIDEESASLRPIMDIRRRSGSGGPRMFKYSSNYIFNQIFYHKNNTDFLVDKIWIYSKGIKQISKYLIK
jgi:hypothetical protein